MRPLISPSIARRGARPGSGLFDELIIDNFAGGGGASMGIEAAMGRSVDIAINHDAHSVQMHQLNHPHTRHLCEDVWDVDPDEATAGRPVGLAWFSPDCRHFSRAKGGKPVEKKIRGLAWIVIKWAKAVKPRMIILENVREFQDWGPLTADSRPCAARKGQTFRRWTAQLRNLGYAVEFRVLNAADFGAPTHRRRFFLIARCDGQPIAWPEPTHGPGRKPYHTAAECIDWSLPCPSIFLTKAESKLLGVIRPLAEKTMRRIAMGLKRYVLDNPKPFIVTCNHSGPEFRGQSVDEPFKTVTAARDAHGLVVPYVAGVGGRAGQSPATAGDAPIGTITAKNDRAVVTPYLTRCAHGDNCSTGAKRWGKGEHSTEEPLPTLTGSKDFAVTAPLLVEVQNASNVGHRAIDRPAHTITSNPKGGGVALVAPHLVKFRGDSAGGSVTDPMPTITSGDGSVRPAGAAHAMGVCAPTLIQTGYGERDGQAPRAPGLDKPIGTLVGSQKHALVSAFLAKHYGGVIGHEVTRPLGTVTARDHHSVVASHLEKLYGTAKGQDAREPMPTITAGGNHLAEVLAFLTKYYGNGDGQPLTEPLHTVTTKDRLGVVIVQAHEYLIVDIGLRMLQPRELLRAQFGKYAKDYILTGTKSQQVAKIGNSVPPELAEAVVRANVSREVEAAA